MHHRPIPPHHASAPIMPFMTSYNSPSSSVSGRTPITPGSASDLSTSKTVSFAATDSSEPKSEKISSDVDLSLRSDGKGGSSLTPFDSQGASNTGSNVDPQWLSAHNRAMMVAKQHFQATMAQQAAMAASDAWESQSTMSGMGMGMNPMMGMGMGMGMGMNPMMPQMMPGFINPYMAHPGYAASAYAGSTMGSVYGGFNGGAASVMGINEPRSHYLMNRDAAFQGRNSIGPGQFPASQSARDLHSANARQLRDGRELNMARSSGNLRVEARSRPASSIRPHVQSRPRITSGLAQ